ncbi:hypothetical protein Golax_004616, partial [Gossypium laxum]|nr:hypothetical protein [Gossypium laxum]
MTIKSKYQSELLTATDLDGNEGIFPIAFAIVDVVNDDNWHLVFGATEICAFNIPTKGLKGDLNGSCNEEVLQVIITHFYDAPCATALDNSYYYI